MTDVTVKSLDELTLGRGLNLEDLVDRAALGEMVDSFHSLFRVPLRVFSEDGTMLASTESEPEVYGYLRELSGTRVALENLISEVKAIDPSSQGEVSYPCITGALYRVSAIPYDGRQIGRLILGPFLPPNVREVPSILFELEPDLDATKLKALVEKLPVAKERTIGQIARHLKSALDLILFSGHKALLTSNMHLATVHESFRELQEKNTELQEAYNRLKELDRLKSNFLATVSHELRTPLTSIIGYSEMLSEGIGGSLNPDQTEFVTTIHEKGEQLLELIMGLLDLSKLESGTMSMSKGDISAAPVVRDAVQTLQPTARKRGIRIVAKIDDALPSIWADPDRLRQILLNLSENAMKFTPENGTVTISAEPTMMDMDEDTGGLVLLANKRPAVALKVADTGIGISDGEKERVFDAFYQVDSSSTREYGGTGLGLSIVKRLVDGHNGTIHIEDNTPSGAVFVVTLPCRRASLY